MGYTRDFTKEELIEIILNSKEKAVAAFRKRVDSDDRLLAEEYGYEIYEDSDTCFDSGEDGEYVKDHISVFLEEVVGCDNEAS